MKKTIFKLILSFLAVAIILSVTTVIIIQKSANEIASSDFTPSNDYEVLDWHGPDKDIYYLSDVQTVSFETSEETNDIHFRQFIDFDCEGLTMTVKHKKTGDTKTYNYSGYSFEVDGEENQYNNVNFTSKSSMSVQYIAQADTILTPGQFEAQVILVTDNGDCVVENWSFLLMDDPKSSLTMHSKKDDIHSEPETTPEGMPILPDISRAWYHAKEPGVHYLSITDQEDGSFTLHISSVTGEDSPIATADVPITLENVHRDGSIVTGESDFEYTDSYGNKGVGKINVHEDAIILVINEVYSSGSNLGISKATGVYY